MTGYFWENLPVCFHDNSLPQLGFISLLLSLSTVLLSWKHIKRLSLELAGFFPSRRPLWTTITNVISNSGNVTIFVVACAQNQELLRARNLKTAAVWTRVMIEREEKWRSEDEKHLCEQLIACGPKMLGDREGPAKANYTELIDK